VQHLIQQGLDLRAEVQALLNEVLHIEADLV